MMMSLNRESDDRLVCDMLAGRQQAFSRLVERYLQTAHAVAFAHTGNHADAEDAAQDAFLKAYQSLDTLRDRRRFGPWLATLTRNAAIDLVRKRQRRDKLTAQLSRDEPRVTPEPERRDERALVREHILAMDEGPREVILLHYFAGHSLREVGQILGISRAAAQKRLVRAREQLSEGLVRSLGEAQSGVRPREARVKSVMGAVAAAPVAWKASAATASAGVAGAGTSAVALLTPKTLALMALVLLSVGTGLWAILNNEDELPPTQTALVADSTDRETPSGEQVFEELLGNVTPKAEDSEPRDSVTPSAPQIQGHVIDETGKLMPGVKVLPRLVTVNADGTEELGKGEIHAQTGADGAFSIDGLSPGAYDVQLLVPGSSVYTSRSFKRFTLAENEAIEGMPIIYDRREGITIFGRVVDHEGNPVADARVSTKGAQLFEARTGAAGKFSFVRFKDGTFNLSAYHPKHGSAFLPQRSYSADGFHIVLAGRGEIEGQVVAAESDRPLKDFSLVHVDGWTEKPFWGGYRAFRDYHDEEGRFRLGDLEAGNVTLVVRAPNRATKIKIGTTVHPGKTTSGVVVPLERGVSLRGQVVDGDGEPVADAYVFEGPMPGVRANDYEKVAKGRTDARGYFGIDNIGLNTNVITAYHAEHLPAGMASVDLHGATAQPVVIALGLGARISGYVYLDDTPLEGINVRLIIDDPADTRGVAARTNSEGYYELRNVPQGVGKVRAELYDGPGMLRDRSRSVPVVVAAGDTQEVGIVFSSTGGAIEGLATYNGTAPPNMGIVAAITEPGGTEESQSVPIEPDGTYRIEPLPAGTADFWMSWNREPNTLAARPVDIGLPVGQVEVLRHNFVFQGSNEDIEQGFWDAIGAE